MNKTYKKSNDIEWSTLFFITTTIILSLTLIYTFIGNNDSSRDSSDSKEILLTEPAIDCSKLPEYQQEKCMVDSPSCIDDKCIYTKAMVYNNENFCFNISDEKLTLKCTSTIKRSQLLEKAVIEKNIEFCNEFDTTEDISFCRDNFYIAKRFNENDLSVCENIVDKVIKEDCLR